MNKRFEKFSDDLVNILGYFWIVLVAILTFPIWIIPYIIINVYRNHHKRR